MCITIIPQILFSFTDIYYNIQGYEIYAEDYCGLKSEKITISGNINIYKPVELSSDMAIYNEDWSDFLILFCLLKAEL